MIPNQTLVPLNLDKAPDKAPTDLEIPILLSFKMIIGAKSFWEPKKFNPSKATPLTIDESPIKDIILLLDDVLAELDDVRQNYLLKSINKNTQTIITSVDTILFEDEFLKDVEIFKIDNGEII